MFFLRIWIGLFIYQQQYFTFAIVSFNQPRFRINATWNSNAMTFVGKEPVGIFINSNNSIYITDVNADKIHIWQNENDLNPTKTISGNLSDPFSLFVTTNGDIYVDNGYSNGRVDKWIRENERWISVMNVSSACYGLFVDIYENLYCSMGDNERVDKNWSTIAGTGVLGSQSDMLNNPCGIFVDINLDLYVADSGNNRIQLFRLNQRNGITVVGKGSAKLTIELNLPSGIVLDGDQHLFIVDSGNHRIVGSDENGFRCIFGCSGFGRTNDKLTYPRAMSFDSYGNIYVTDLGNNRMQKIFLSKKSDIPSTSQSEITTDESTYFEESTTVTPTTTPSTFITMSTEITSTFSNNGSKSLYVSFILCIFNLLISFLLFVM